jgi:hypothetical protein
LNTLAGRSFNDLSQYPVLPWILADYSSPELDLDDPQSYRDLSRPMGALSTARAVKFQERYDEWDEQDNEGVPKWHYGSHYSSAGIVALFLIRLEPFTQHYVRLQSGRFDVPDRIFCNVQASWFVPVLSSSVSVVRTLAHTQMPSQGIGIGFLGRSQPLRRARAHP